MTGKVVINCRDGNIEINSSLQGQDLYNALVGLTAHIAARLVNSGSIVEMSVNAAKDALKLLEVVETNRVTS